MSDNLHMIEELPQANAVGLEPMRITLCGSTRFRAAFELWNKRLSLAGFLVYSVSGFGHSGDSFSAAEKERLDLVHLAKIDASHAVVVIDLGGYIGESTAREIARAKATGREVYYVHGDPTVYRLRTGPDGPASQRYKAFSYNDPLSPQQGVTAYDVEHQLAAANGFGASYQREQGRWILYSMPDAKPFGAIDGFDKTSIDFVMDALRAALKVRPSRDQIAEIIDPEAFAPMEDIVGMRVAYAKADAILSGGAA